MAAPERMSRGRYWRNPTGTVHPKTVGGTRLYIRPRTRDSKPIGQVLSPLIRSRTLHTAEQTVIPSIRKFSGTI